MTSPIVKTVMASILSAGVVVATQSAQAADKCPMEKCYGVSKQKMNDCAANGHACAGQATTSNDPNEWIYINKGSCERIPGGALKPAK